MAASDEDHGRIFCGLVMKGGITSGVVYPTAIAELAKTYQLRNIGGASAGAIAAAGAAAAEYRRQTDRHQGEGMAGFERLARLSKELGETLGTTGHTRLLSLFAPTGLSQPIFSVLAGMLNRPSVRARIGFGLVALIRAFPLALLVGLVLWIVAMIPLERVLLATDWASPARCPSCAVDALGLVTGMLAITAFAMLAVLAFAFWRSLRHFFRVMSTQNFGLCTGMREDHTKDPPALTEWLYDLFQDIAGKQRGEPLTFGDLRRVSFSETPSQDGIVLRTTTTCLTAGRPYTLPMAESRLYFDPVELRQYFPEDVVHWMQCHPWRARDGRDAAADRVAADFALGGALRPLVPLPAADDWPVVVAVRMSLSFPILLSAIPLYRHGIRRSVPGQAPSGVEADPPDAQDGAWTGYMERMYFTDGGVCSNLPIHMFDTPLPAWPTFAINLRDDLREDLPEEEQDHGRVVSPKRGRSYQRDRYAISSTPDMASTMSFLEAIVKTMQNWRDMLQRGAAGFRERVYTVRHTAKEGGLNLDMPALAIEKLAESGARTARAMCDQFHPDRASRGGEDDWIYSRWVRIRLLLPALEDFLATLDVATRGEPNWPTAFELLLDSTPYVGRSFELNQASREAAGTFLEELGQATQRLEAARSDLGSHSPKPAGVLRMTPTF